MTTPANDQIAAELHTLNEGIATLQKTLLFAAESMHSAQIFAARMIAAKKDCDFNEACNMGKQAHDNLIERYKELFL